MDLVVSSLRVLCAILFVFFVNLLTVQSEGSQRTQRE